MQLALPDREIAVTSDDERAAACALAGLGGIGAQSLAAIRAMFGSLAAAVAKGGAAIAQTPGLRSDGIESLKESPDLARRGQWLLTKAHELGAQVIVLEDSDYPPLLRTVSSPPPVLYVKGKLEPARRVAVVGTREVDEYGIARTEAVVDLLCAAGVEVVSGGAYGVDTKAHARALDRGGRTTAIVGSGFLKLYPSENDALFDRIASKGALVSEFALDSGGNQRHFPQRNRTMAALSEAVVITRGTLKSGALITCQAATKFGRPVFAVPGAVGDALAAAPNSVLSSGTARALVTGAEVLAAIGLNAPTLPPPIEREAPAISTEGLSAPAKKVFDALGPSPRHIDEIATTASVPMSDALVALSTLEISGLCVKRPGMYFLRR